MADEKSDTAIARERFAQFALDLAAHGGAGREPQRQAAAAQLIGGVDLELPAEPAVIGDVHCSTPLSGAAGLRGAQCSPGAIGPGDASVLLRVHAGQTRRRGDRTQLQHATDGTAAPGRSWRITRRASTLVSQPAAREARMSRLSM